MQQYKRVHNHLKQKIEIYLAKIGITEKFYTFATADRFAEARSGQSGRVCRHNQRLLTLLLDFPKSGKFQSSSRRQQTVDALVDMFNSINGIRVSVFPLMCGHIFCVRLLQFARSTKMGNTRASESGTSNSTALTQFFYPYPT